VHSPRPQPFLTTAATSAKERNYYEGDHFHPRAAIFAASATAVTALTVAVAPTAPSDNTWGACAVPANPRLYLNAECVVAGVTGYPTEDDAKNRAIALCNYLKNRQCYVVVSFTDCGAIAQGGDQWAGGTGPTVEAAQQAALNQLPGSTIRKSICIAPG
jgi:hypothetical protein